MHHFLKTSRILSEAFSEVFRRLSREILRCLSTTFKLSHLPPPPKNGNMVPLRVCEGILLRVYLLCDIVFSQFNTIVTVLMLSFFLSAGHERATQCH